jgi:nucleotide-binding universal stress UspA family protein
VLWQPKASTEVASSESGAITPAGLVLFAYDGSELAALAIEEAARQLAPGRDALVLCVWQPAEVGFVPINERHFDADDASQVKQAAEETAAHGASLAANAGFRTQSIAVEAAPTWKAIIDTALEHDASLIVLGCPRRGRLAGHVLGSVAADVVKHSPSSVLVVHPRS